MSVTALYIDPTGPYPALLGPENCWDEERDARKFFSSTVTPVIAHPPCGRWCAMARLNERRWGAKVGDDGGCFKSALNTLQSNAGVLEHPAGSLAWPEYALEKPNSKGGWKRVADNRFYFGHYWVCQLNQAAYGHICTKATWLVYSGKSEPFALRWDKVKGTHQIGGGVNTGNNAKPRATKAQAIHSPVEFAKTLVALAELSAK